MRTITVKKKLDREEQEHQQRLVDERSGKKLGKKKAEVKVVGSKKTTKSKTK